MPIHAVTFDFWRTLFQDNLAKERHRARCRALSESTGVDYEQAKEAMKFVMMDFLRVHITEQRTLAPEDAVDKAGEYLKIEIDEEKRGPLADYFGAVILEFPPDPIEGAVDAVKAAADRLPIGIISDTGISPGSALTVLLERHGFIDSFGVLAFSGDVGVAKPQRAIYEHAANGLGVDINTLFHIGDLEPTDVKGALEIGATAALFAGDNDRFAENTNAHHTFHTWAQFIEAFPALIDA